VRASACAAVSVGIVPNRFDRWVTAMKIGRFSEIAAPADAELRDFSFGSRTSAFRTNSRIRIVRRSRELLEGKCAFSTGVIEERHPRHSSPSLERPEASCFKTRVAIP
jgi:hypothetical protein